MNTKKPTENAMKKTINRSALLGRASTMTVAAAAAATASMFGAADAQAADPCFNPGPVNAVNLMTPQQCVIIDDPVSNSIVINADVEENASTPAFEVSDIVGGRLTNNATISNAGSITGGIALSVYGGDIAEGITNAGLLFSYGSTALSLSYGSVVGGIVNSGTISGDVGLRGTDGIVIDGNIVNAEEGLIEGDSIAIWLYGDASLDGNISNQGTIEGSYGAILIDTSSFSSSIVNADGGVIRALGDSSDVIAIHIASDTAFTNLTNAGLIEGVDGGFVFVGDHFYGDIHNSGTITSSGTIGALRIGVEQTSSGDFLTSEITGGVTNTGLIDGGEGWGVAIEGGEIGQTGSIFTAANEANSLLFMIEGGYEIDNRDDIVGGVLVNGDEVAVNIVNRSSGSISALYGDADVGLQVSALDLYASILNDGVIEGSSVGMMVGADPIFSFKNNNLLSNIETQTTLIGIEASHLIASINNRGLITGATAGMKIIATNSLLLLSNSGTISATGEDPQDLATQDQAARTGLLINPDSTVCTTSCISLNTSVAGTIENSGLIIGDDGAAIYLSSFYGQEGGTAIENTGSIIGETGTGLVIDVTNWYGDIVNSGLIDGASTGASFHGDSFYGDIINNGDITGGQLTTGLHVAYSSYLGDIVNNDLLSAPGNALHVEVDAFYGDIVNNGTILASYYGGTAALLENFNGSGSYEGSFSNTGLIEGGGEGTGVKVQDARFAYGIINGGGIINDGGTITAQTAIDTQYAYGMTEILNTGGGYIEGDLVLSRFYGDTFIAEDGGIRGDIFGEGGEGGYNDGVNVRDGDHYFIGKASALQAFTVQSGGTAFMGTEGEWSDTQASSLSGPDYFYGSNIDSLNVQDGGRLYMSDTASFEVESFTQSAYGELTYFLTSNESAHGQIRNPGSTGSVMLGGTVSVDLDVESFTGITDNTFTYEDVISANSLSGGFTNASVIGSPFFELDVVYDQGGEGNPDTVDLLLTRTSFASLSCSTSTQNNEALGQMLEAAFQAGDLTSDQLALYQAILNSADGCDVSSTYDDLSGTPFDFIAFQLDGPFKKMVGARIDSGRSTGCVVAGSADCFNRYAADTTGSSTVMNDGTPGGDPFAWLRSGVREEGASAVWGRGVGVWGETDGDTMSGAPGSRYNQKGGIIGADHVFTETFIAGVAAQYTDTDIKFPGQVDRVAVNSYEVGTYASYGDTQGYINANASYIWHNFDTYRQVFGSDTKGQFDGGTLSACLELGRIYEADGWRLQPVGALSFASLSTDGYTELGTSLSRLVVKDSGFDSLKSILGGRIAYPVEMESGRRWVPEVRVSWSHEFMDNSAEFDARLFSFAEDPASYFTTKGAEYDRDSVNLGTGMNAPINDKIIVYVDYDASLSSDQTSQTASAGLRVLW